jgi:phage baseplate assembly protein gpV
MNAVQGQITWLPGLLQDKDSGAGLTGVLYNTPGLVVTYQKSGGPVEVKTLTASDWAEGVEGSYNIRFLATELNTLGLFSYWIEYPPSTTYPGAVTVVKDIDFQPNITVQAPDVTVTMPPTTGFSMNVTKRQLTWLPARLSHNGVGIAEVPFDAVTVTYQKTGGAIMTKTLMETDWSEGVDGAYSIKFTPEELDTNGLFQYWVSHPDSPTYGGAAQVTEANSGPGQTERSARITINGQPIDGAEVWISSDEAGRDVIAGIKLTNALGIVKFNLDPGDYWIHWRKARVLQDGKQQWKVI